MMERFILVLYSLTLILNAVAITAITLRNNQRFKTVRKYFESKEAVREGKALMIPDRLTRSFLNEYAGRWGTLRITTNDRYWFDKQRYMKSFRYGIISIVVFLVIISTLLILSVISFL
jgi:hypothetical protein